MLQPPAAHGVLHSKATMLFPLPVVTGAGTGAFFRERKSPKKPLAQPS